MTADPQRLVILGGRIGLLVALIAGTEIGVRTGALNQIFFSSPSEIVHVLVKQATAGTLLTDVWVTFSETLLGLVLGSALGMAAGLVLPQVRVLAQIVEPFLFTLNGIPVIVIAPLFILWLGIGVYSKIGIGIYIVFFSMFTPVYTNAIRIEREFVDLLYVMGASRRQIFAKVIVPSSLPAVYTGLKIGTGLSLIGAVIGEFVSSRQGLGHMILYASGTLDTPSLYLGILILAAFAAALTTGVNILGRFLVRWRYADEK
jgi:NitT/TauT family transport system permease protein